MTILAIKGQIGLRTYFTTTEPMIQSIDIDK